MEEPKQNDHHIHPNENSKQPIIIDASKMDNAVLKRLIGEIDFEKENRLHAYNRTHNRHNRGR